MSKEEVTTRGIQVKGSLSDHVTELLNKELGTVENTSAITIYTADAVGDTDTDELIEIGAAVTHDAADDDTQETRNVVYYRHGSMLQSSLVSVESYLSARNIDLVHTDQGLIDYLKYKV